MQRQHRVFVGLAGLLLIAVSATGPAWAQTDDWAKVVEAAKKEGEVFVWGQSGDARRRFWKDSFEKAYPGIIVNLFQPGSASERDVRVLREYEAGLLRVDVLVSGSGTMLGQLKPKNALQPLRPFLRADILDGRNWIDGEAPWNDDEKQYVITSDQGVMIPIIANMRAPELKSWNDLLDPKWSGKIMSLDPRASGMASGTVNVIYRLPHLGSEFLAKMFAKGRVIFAADDRQTVEWVEAGRMQLGFALRDPEITAIEKVGGKVRSYTTLELDGVQQGITVGADGVAGVPNLNPLPHPNAARLYLNWYFSKEGQQAMVDSIGIASTHTGVDMKAISQRSIQLPGRKYHSANSEANVRAQRPAREIVSKAIEGR